MICGIWNVHGFSRKLQEVQILIEEVNNIKGNTFASLKPRKEENAILD